jgi:hypothetical protein
MFDWAAYNAFDVENHDSYMTSTAPTETLGGCYCVCLASGLWVEDEARLG